MIAKLDKLSFQNLIFLLIVVVGFFWMVYFGLSINASSHGIESTIQGGEEITALNTLYFSVVTFSSLGYGDFRPLGYSRLFANIEVILGLVFIALVVAKLASERQSRLVELLISQAIGDKLLSFRNDISKYAESFEEMFQDHRYGEIISEVSRSKKLLGGIQSYIGFHAHDVETLHLTTESLLRRLLVSMQDYLEIIAVIARSGVIEDSDKPKIDSNITSIKNTCESIKAVSGAGPVEIIATGIEQKIEHYFRLKDKIHFKHRHKNITKNFKIRVKNAYDQMSDEEKNSENVHAVLAKKLENTLSNKLVLKALVEIFITKDFKEKLKISYDQMSDEDKNSGEAATILFNKIESNMPNKILLIAMKELGVKNDKSRVRRTEK